MVIRAGASPAPRVWLGNSSIFGGRFTILIRLTTEWS